MTRIVKKLVITLALWQTAAVVVSCAGWLQSDGQVLFAEPTALSKRLADSVLTPDAAGIAESRKDLRDLRWFHGTTPRGESDESRLVARLAELDGPSAVLEADRFLRDRRSATQRVAMPRPAYGQGWKLAVAEDLHSVSRRFQSLDQWLWILLDEFGDDRDRSRIAAMLADFREDETRYRLLRAALRLGSAAEVWSPKDKSRLLTAMGGALWAGSRPPRPRLAATQVHSEAAQAPARRN